MGLKVKELRDYLHLHDVPTHTCREKEELVELVLDQNTPSSSSNSSSSSSSSTNGCSNSAPQPTAPDVSQSHHPPSQAAEEPETLTEEEEEEDEGEDEDEDEEDDDDEVTGCFYCLNNYKMVYICITVRLSYLRYKHPRHHTVCVCASQQTVRRRWCTVAGPLCLT